MQEHGFTENIKEILKSCFKNNADYIFQNSTLIQYLNIKTKSANRGAKSRSSFGSLYAIYVLVEDYINKGYLIKGDYSLYEGAIFSDLLKGMRELPFGNKLQNHALNHRMNSEYRKYFPNSEYTPILREQETHRYWINENLLKIRSNDGKENNIAKSIISIIDEYIKMKRSNFEKFLLFSYNIENKSEKEIHDYIYSLIAPNIDARIFEIVSYSILKYYYYDTIIYWGYDKEELNEQSLLLYKTGRTNANDGGIDFVMKPLGRFYQVTETLDIKKYMLDIDKIQRYPITFVIKFDKSVEEIYETLRNQAKKQYGVQKIVERYMNSIEEVINIARLKECFEESLRKGHIKNIVAEIVTQSKVEFNYDEDDDISEIIEEIEGDYEAADFLNDESR